MNITAKRILPTLMALVLSVAAFAGVAYAADTGTITITPPSGVGSDATNTYKIYKVFDAVGDGTNISYKLVDGKSTAPAGFSVDAAGNVTYVGSGTEGQLTADDIAAIAAYVTEGDLVGTVTTTGSAAGVSDALPNGYYYITTSLGTVVTISSTNPNAKVNDKNTVPDLDKKITGASSYDEDGKNALAQIGSTVTYTATITVGKGQKDYVFHDKMSEGLTYNNDIVITGIDAGQYTVKETPDSGDTITVTFANGLAEGTVITLTYTATINELALSNDPENNTAYVSYGDENGTNKTPDSETHVYNAKFTVTKEKENGEPLGGAGFVIRNSDGKYYKLEGTVVSWVDAIADATEHISNDQGEVTAFIGLANGTYTLVEKTVPEGYNKAADKSFTIQEHNYTSSNLEQSTEVVNKAGTELPSTGGIGTTIFYVVGSVLVVGIGLIAFARRLARKE